MSNVRMRYLGRYLPKNVVMTDTLENANNSNQIDDPFFKRG